VNEITFRPTEYWLTLLRPSEQFSIVAALAAEKKLNVEMEAYRKLAAQQKLAAKAEKAARRAANIALRGAALGRRRASILARRLELLDVLGPVGPEPEPAFPAQSLLVPPITPQSRPLPIFLQGTPAFRPSAEDAAPVAQPVQAKGLLRVGGQRLR
jgi:hypothetical protein